MDMRLRDTAALLLILSLPGLAACGREKAGDEDVRPVRSVTVTPGATPDHLSLTGEIRARYESDLGFRIDGKIIERPVDIGSKVSAGDVLARLDTQPWTQSLQSAKADVAAAQATLAKDKAAESRQGQLLKDGFTTRANYDDALAALKTAQSQLDAADARLKQAEDNLGYAALHADADGVITAVSANVGQVVSAGQAVIRLAQPGEREAVFNASEATLLTAPKNPTVIITLLANPAIKATGLVRYVSPQADPTTRTYEVRIALTDPPPEMRLGASVTGSVAIDQTALVALPGGALFQSGGTPAVWVVDPKSLTVSLKPVVVSRYTAQDVILSGGLVNGDIVVTAGVQKLVPGQKVRLLEQAGG
jgi:RND family efflux transporter MFP subunit